MGARKITFFPGTGPDPEIVLGDDAIGQLISGGEPEETREVETFHPTRGEYCTRFNRGGKVNRLTWRVDRMHADPAAAVEFMRDHAAEIPHPLGEAVGYLADVGADGSVRCLQACSIISVRCLHWNGRSTVFEYTAEGGAWADASNT